MQADSWQELKDGAANGGGDGTRSIAHEMAAAGCLNSAILLVKSGGQGRNADKSPARELSVPGSEVFEAVASDDADDCIGLPDAALVEKTANGSQRGGGRRLAEQYRLMGKIHHRRANGSIADGVCRAIGPAHQ